MIDIDAMDRQQLTTFLSNAGTVTKLQDNFQSQYEQLMNGVFSHAQELILNEDFETLEKEYPEIYEQIMQNTNLKETKEQIKKDKLKMWLHGWRLLAVLGMVILVAVVLTAIFEVMAQIPVLVFIAGPISQFFGLIAMVAVFCLYGYLFITIIQYFFGGKNRISDGNMIAKRLSVQSKQNYRNVVENNVLSLLDQTQQVQNFMRKWNNTIENLDDHLVASYAALPQDYRAMVLIDKMLEYLRQHRAHNFEDLVNLMFKEIREDQRHADHMSGYQAVKNSVHHMNDNLVNIGNSIIQSQEAINNNIVLGNRINSANLAENEANLAENKRQSDIASDTNRAAREAAANTKR
ncbi:hypothetical protein [Tetragenococcus koreensis]|uniref:Uncharacterized protein n=1 Tax=Tetragenococcus koreensis TaxID=290335 RepID=A0AAN4UD54_9ENTE|nr:hypothetical protein [Tetragenococcus koreensis]MDN6836797.1 hypothetical protein [Lactococcus lactis]MDN6664579.1 hypothetical protein [Tetragenococcus koreensis]GEQ50129.1 hypothetical protein TK11N_19810 [Tetragenococcus koreensis]GEQ52620.1 hypothetical protein TK12N_19640 [Tetragenococcus koreensis]GEQ55155.1 hypothetical protein TK2N_19990 [Tetragenococcus koreensis]